MRCEIIDYEYDFNSNYSTIVIENGNQSTTTTILPSITSTPIPVTSHVCSNNKTICLNGGICNPTSIKPYYNCSCPSGLSGNNCENSKLFLSVSLKKKLKMINILFVDAYDYTDLP